MEIDPVLIIVVGGSVGALLIERVFYYKSKYRKKPIEPVPAADVENPGHGERIGILENEVKNIKDDNKEDHELMRKDIRKLFNLINGMKK